MTAFDIMTATLFADPNLPSDALYRAGGAGDGVAIRVIKTNPDRLGSFGETRFISITDIIESRAEDTPSLAEGDTFEISGTIYTVKGDPKRDDGRRTWTAQTRAT